MTLFIHTQIEISSVPAHDNGIIHLQSMNSHQAVRQSLAHICFREDLHKDFNLQLSKIYLEKNGHMELNGQDEYIFNHISSSWRKASVFTVIKCKDERVQFMTYRNQIHFNRQIWIPNNEHELFPFAPETVAHIQCFVRHMQAFVSRFYTAHTDVVAAMPGIQNFWCEAIKMGGVSCSSDYFMHIPLELTHCLTRDRNTEWPVVILGGFNFLAVIVRRGNAFRLRPVEPTSLMQCIELQNVHVEYDIEQWSSLPLKTVVAWHADELGLAQSHGLYWQDDSAHMRHPREILCSSLLCMPMALMPVIMHQVLVNVQVYLPEINLYDVHEQVTKTVTSISAEDLFEAHSVIRWSLAKSREWFSAQKDMTPLRNENDDFYVVEFPGGEMQFWIVHVRNMREFYFFYNNRAHLKFTLNQYDGIPLLDTAWENWQFRDRLFGNGIYMSLHQPRVFQVMWRDQKATTHIDNRSDSTSTPFVAYYEYEDTAYSSCLMRYERASDQYAKMLQDSSSNPETLEAMRETLSDRENSLRQTMVVRTQKDRFVCNQRGTKSYSLRVADCHPHKHVLGVTLHHQDKVQWMVNGNYMISFNYKNEVYSNKMDFVSCLHSVVREGQKLFLKVDRAMMQRIRSVCPDACFSKETRENDLDNDGVVELECFYILGNSTRSYYADVNEVVIDVIILVCVQSCDNSGLFVFEDNNPRCKILVSVPLVQNDTYTVSLGPNDQFEQEGYLVYEKIKTVCEKNTKLSCYWE